MWRDRENHKLYSFICHNLDVENEHVLWANHFSSWRHSMGNAPNKQACPILTVTYNVKTFITTWFKWQSICLQLTNCSSGPLVDFWFLLSSDPELQSFFLSPSVASVSLPPSASFWSVLVVEMPLPWLSSSSHCALYWASSSKDLTRTKTHWVIKYLCS